LQVFCDKCGTRLPRGYWPAISTDYSGAARVLTVTKAINKRCWHCGKPQRVTCAEVISRARVLEDGTIEIIKENPEELKE